MTLPSSIAITCPQCGTQLAASLVVCPACHRLVHAQQLNELAAQATAVSGSDPVEAMRLWREALELLPPDSRQYAAVAAKITALGSAPAASRPRSSATAGSASSGPRSGKAVAGAAAIGLLLWKLKFIAVFAITKAKFLLMGLGKGSTFVTMFLSFAVYWTAWGWLFALGLVLSIYIHEMGHVAALRRYGFKATAPMFIPGFGALIRLHQHPVNASEDARIGLAGPLWGLGAALAALVIWRATANPLWGAIAHVGAWINLFNLVPLWQLDGGRGFRALSRRQAWLLIGVIAATWFLTSEGLLLLMLLAGIVQAMAKPADSAGDRPALALCSVLTVVLALMSRIPVPMVPA